MPPQEQQQGPQQNQMSPEDAKAIMGTATHLQSFLLPPKVDPQGTPPQAPQQDPDAQKIDALQQEFQDFKKQVGSSIKEEMGGIKDLIKQALKEDEPKN